MTKPLQPLTVPNVLSGLRALTTPFFVWAVLTERWLFAFWLFVFAVLSDLLDGPIARRQQSDSALGTRLDHSADVLFTATALAAFVWLGVYSWHLVLLQLLAFLEYTLPGNDNSRFKGSYLGRINGILFFVAIGIPATQNAFHLDWVAPVAITWFGVALAASTLLSLLIRTVARLRS